MSEENSREQQDEVRAKVGTIRRLQLAKNWYVMFSQATRMPYVECDEETYDDEIFIYFEEEQARAEAERLKEEKERTLIMKVEQKAFLAFCRNLFYIGVNCIVVQRGREDEARLQLTDFVRRQEPSKQVDEMKALENPELHLTALYFVQEMRKNGTMEFTDKMKELDEELKVHFNEGKYLVATKDKQPVLLAKDEKKIQPLFTDYQEFWKFNRTVQCEPMIVEGRKLAAILKPGTTGIVLNPAGMNLIMNVERKPVARA